MITLLFSSVQNSEGGGDGDGNNSCVDPLKNFLGQKNLPAKYRHKVT
jgi:hypothetical protein